MLLIQDSARTLQIITIDFITTMPVLLDMHLAVNLVNLDSTTFPIGTDAFSRVNSIVIDDVCPSHGIGYRSVTWVTGFPYVYLTF